MADDSSSGHDSERVNGDPQTEPPKKYHYDLCILGQPVRTTTAAMVLAAVAEHPGVPLETMVISVSEPCLVLDVPRPSLE